MSNKHNQYHNRSFASRSLTVHISDDNSVGKFEFFVFSIVRGLLKAIVNRPPTIVIEAIAVCGTHRPKTIVAPTNGAVSNHILAQTMVENAQIFFFSSRTSSVVHVVNIARVDDIAVFETIEIAIRIATRASPVTVGIEEVFLFKICNKILKITYYSLERTTQSTPQVRRRH